MKAYKFRIYPSKTQETKMRTHIWLSKELWNEMLAFTKEIYNNHQKFPTKRTLREFVKNSGLFSQVGQELVDRLLDALHRKIQMKKKGEKGGFPRFKSIDRMKSLHYPQFGFKLGKKLEVTPFGEIAIKKHREVEGRIKTLTLKRESSSKWFAVFCVEQHKPISKKNRGQAVGIDLGLKNFAVFSDGAIIKNPRHLKRHEDRLAWYQQRLSRKKKGGRNRRKARLRVALIHEKVANARADFLHKTTTQLVNDYSLIALEKLASREMSGQNFGKQINDASWGTFANMLCYKAEEAGCSIVFVDAKNTTKECSNCGTIVEKEIRERIHHCSSCGFSIDRDLNAARNILAKATLGHKGSNACEDGTIVPSMKQEAHTYS